MNTNFGRNPTTHKPHAHHPVGLRTAVRGANPVQPRLIRVGVILIVVFAMISAKLIAIGTPGRAAQE